MSKSDYILFWLVLNRESVPLKALYQLFLLIGQISAVTRE